MKMAAAAPDNFLSGYENTMVLDEVQMVPEIFRPLKAKVDNLRLEDKSTSNGCYLPLPPLTESLVGRMNFLTLYPFCTAESTGRKGTGLEKIFSMNFFWNGFQEDFIDTGD